MNFNEYKEKNRTLYKEFADLVRRLLKPKIVAFEFNLHTIQARAKTADSLNEKLIKADLLHSDNLEKEIKDLAGCRIIFYLDSDVQKFMSSGIVRQTFEVIPETYKVHHPKDKIQSSNDFYMADHFVVELSDSLLSIPKYSEFQGLRCEIQVCTILNHAYAAMNHKIYKKSEVAGFANKKFQSIERRLISLAESHMVQAGYEFQKIYDDLQDLSVGKSIYEREILKEVSAPINNYERYILLKRFREYTLPNLDDIAKKFSEIIDIVNAALQAAKIGENYLNVFTECIAILDYVKYINPEAIFIEYLKLYDNPKWDNKKPILSKVKFLSVFNLHILEKAGYFVQDCLCTYISKLNCSARLKFKEIIIEVCKSILDVNYEKIILFTFSFGSLLGSSKLLDIRVQAIGFLKELSDLSKTEVEKQEIFEVLNSSIRIRRIWGCDNDILLTTLKNGVEVVVYYIERASSLSYEFASLVESSFFSIYELIKVITKRTGVSDEVLNEAKKLKEKFLEFCKLLNKDAQYIIYKTLMGYNSVFRQEWTKKSFSYDQKQLYREAKVNKFISSISSKKESYWEKITIRCSKTQTHDNSVLAYYVKFLELLGVNRPTFAYKLVSEKNQELSGYLCYLMVGLIKSDLKDEIIKLGSQWICEGKYLEQLVWVYRRTQFLGNEMLIIFANKAIELNDTFILKYLISGVIENFNSVSKNLIKRVIVPVVACLAINKDATWVAPGLINPSKADIFFGAMDASDVDVVLGNLVYLNTIDYAAELVLLPIANHYPAKLIAFFGERLTHEPVNESRYDSLPYSFSRLREHLASHVNLILDAAIIWYQDGVNDFRYKGARFIKLIFPNFNAGLEQALQTLLQKNFDLYLPMVLSILENYSGEFFLYDTCKKIVTNLSDDSQFLIQIQSIMLGQSNIVCTSGEFGRVKFYKDKKLQIQTWAQDADPKVKQFSKRLLQKVDNIIGSEKRQAEQDIARRNME